MWNRCSRMGRHKQFDPEAVLDLAVDAFWERGFEATSIQELCVRLELNPGSLYGTYGDKRALFAAIFDRYLERVSRYAIERIAKNPSGIEGIRDYFAFLVDAIVDGKRRWGCLVTNSLIELSTREPEILTKVGLHFARLETAFASALARSQAAGELPTGSGARESAIPRLLRPRAQCPRPDEADESTPESHDSGRARVLRQKYYECSMTDRCTWY